MKKQIIIIISVVAVVALLIAGYLIFQKKKPEKAEESNIDVSIFQTPEGFVWEGSYIDTVNGYAVLTIEQGKGKKYNCSISVPSSDVSHIDSYEFEAEEAPSDLGLEYTGGVHTEYLIPDADSDAQITSDQLYTDGSGVLYCYNGYVFWLDDKDSAGEGFMFLKQEAGAEN